ncbi:hypothetical protein [Herbidospora solisilvae]|uniref:hypothetical protein n=1 Tax=Herbidospora solisilvae TaxID=2696284 RepID=UPI001F4843A4|nr:hypothetical protein [Herbidospora solisilvae]
MPHAVTTSTAATLSKAMGSSGATESAAALPTVSVAAALVAAFAGVLVAVTPVVASAVVSAMATPVVAALLVPVAPVLMAEEAASVTAVPGVGRSGGGRSPRSRVPILKRGRAGSVYGC